MMCDILINFWCYRIKRISFNTINKFIQFIVPDFFQFTLRKFIIPLLQWMRIWVMMKIKRLCIVSTCPSYKGHKRKPWLLLVIIAHDKLTYSVKHFHVIFNHRWTKHRQEHHHSTILTKSTQWVPHRNQAVKCIEQIQVHTDIYTLQIINIIHNLLYLIKSVQVVKG